MDNFDEMMKLAEGKKVVVFLDYDGTLSKIVKDPDKATMTQNVKTPAQHLHIIHKFVYLLVFSCGNHVKIQVIYNMLVF